MYLKRHIKYNKPLIIENVKLGKQYVNQGKLSIDNLKKLIEIDPTSSKKYVGWLSKIYIQDNPDMDELRNRIEEYDILLNKNKIKTKDIYQFKSFKDFEKEINDINKTGDNRSLKDEENDYEVILNNDDLLIMSPHTHAASRKIALKYFSFRECPEGGKDSAWCTTYKNPHHFEDYYYERNISFYYIRIKSKDILIKLKNQFPSRWKELSTVAIAVIPPIKIEAFDGLDKKIDKKDLTKFLEIINVNVSNGNIFIPRRIDTRGEVYKSKQYKLIDQYIKNNSQGNLDLFMSPINELPDNLTVNGDLILTSSSLNEIPNNLKVKNDIYLYRTPIYWKYLNNFKKPEKRKEEVRKEIENKGGHVGGKIIM